MIWRRGSAVRHTLEVASICETGPDRCRALSRLLEKQSDWGPAPLTLLGALSVPLAATTHPRGPVARLLPCPHLWLVGFPEPRRSIGAEDLARHAAHHRRQPILAGDVLHGVPCHLRAQLAAGDVGLCARAVHGEPPVALLLPGSKHPAEHRRGR